MQTIEQGYRALSLLVEVNQDRFLFPAAILIGLLTAAYIGSLGLF
ncbi:hypothetical protein [Shimia sp.]